MQSLQRVMASILAADIGAVWTRVVLIDRVDGTFRFVARGDAPTTSAAPHRNVLLGLRSAVQQIEASTGRLFLDNEGSIITPEGADGNGVDLFVASSSAAPPLRVATGGLVERVSGASTRRAALSTYTQIPQSFNLDAPGGRWGQPRGALGVTEQLLEQWPDVIILAGGTEGSSDRDILELTDAIGMAIASESEKAAPAVIYAGNSGLLDEVQARLTPYTALMISENVRPTIREERLRTTGRLLDQQFRARCLNRVPGLEEIRSWSSAELLPTVEALSRVVQFLALSQNKRVLGADIGASSTALAATFENRLTQTLVRADLGITRYANRLLETVGDVALAGWVPGLDSPGDLINQYMNLWLTPAQQPLTRSALLFLQGAARESLKVVIGEAKAGWVGSASAVAPPFDIILGTGGVLRQAPRPQQAMLILLDALQPVGVAHILRDGIGLVPAIGALAEVAPSVAAELVESQGFESLGVAITPIGDAEAGDEIVRFRLTQLGTTIEGAVEAGQLYRFPTNDETALELRPASHIDLGQGQGVAMELTRQGDSVGFVIDARGRPLALPEELEARRARVEEWYNYVGA